MSALLAGLPVPADIRANVLSYAVGVSIDDPRDDPMFDPDETDSDAIVEGLGWKSEYDNTLKVTARILLGDAEIGTARLTVVDREAAGPSFYQTCDAESAALEMVSKAFFAPDGRTPRSAPVKALGDEVRRGGFCYLDEFLVDGGATDPTSDVAAEAITRLLATGPLADKWTFCVYIPEGSPPVRGFPEEKTQEQRRAELEKDQGCWRRDARPFMRVGFAQDDAPAEQGQAPFLFVARSTLRAEPLDPAAAPELRIPALPPLYAEPTQADEALRKYLSNTFLCEIGFVPYGGVGKSEFGRLQAATSTRIHDARTMREKVETSRQECERMRQQLGQQSDAARSALETKIEVSIEESDDLIRKLHGEEETLLAAKRHNDAIEARVAEKERSVAAEIRRHVEECGATVTGARALHIAAAGINTTCLDLLLELGGAGLVNEPDPKNGVAPLAVAAGLILDKAS